MKSQILWFVAFLLLSLAFFFGAFYIVFTPTFAWWLLPTFIIIVFCDWFFWQMTKELFGQILVEMNRRYK